jgi:uncharacterized membrane protein YeaQ/YmgE (transglycosylase-associated protein family)
MRQLQESGWKGLRRFDFLFWQLSAELFGGRVWNPCRRAFARDEGGCMFGLLWTLIIGLIVGALAKLIMPGKDPGGIWITMALGIVGSFVGTWLGRLVGHYGPQDKAGFLMSLVGALIVLAIYHFFKRRTAGSTV